MDGSDAIIYVGNGSMRLVNFSADIMPVIVDSSGNTINLTPATDTTSGGETDTTSGGETDTNKTDYVFIVDYSGSMGEHISKVADVAEQFKTDLASRDIDYRIAVVEYCGQDEIAVTSDFTNDTDEITSALSSVANKSGYGGWQEYGLTAIETALNLDFREDANKKFIVISDEGYAENDSGVNSALSADSVEESLNANNVTVKVLRPVEVGASCFSDCCASVLHSLHRREFPSNHRYYSCHAEQSDILCNSVILTKIFCVSSAIHPA